MSASVVYTQIRRFLKQSIDPSVDESSLERLSLLVLGIIHAQSAAPARIAKALDTLGLSNASAESIERRIRRIENDPELKATLCFHPLAQQRLLWGRPQELLLILDPTTQEDRVVMVSAAVWYRGRPLPLGWVIWPGNIPWKGERFWARITALLDMIAPLLPCGVSVTWLADRAFGTPAFTDLVTARGWHYLVRIQEHTLFRDRLGREWPAKQLAAWPGQRAKRRGHVFKKRGWRPASMLVYWGRRHPERLCLVTDLRPGWYLIALYRRRYPSELAQRGLKVEQQKPLPVVYRGVKLDCGYRLDLRVEEAVIVEVKAADSMMQIQQAQLLSYPKLSGCKVGLLINFNVKDLKDGIRLDEAIYR
jgi:GxxExxY protein